MGRQLIFFMSDQKSIDALAMKIIEMGFEVIKIEADCNGVEKYSHAPATMNDFSKPFFKVRLVRKAYGPVQSLFDPHIEWLQGAVNVEKKKIVRGRIYLNTSDFSKYDEQLCNQLVTDYQQICKSVKKIITYRTLKVNDVTVKKWTDDRTIQLLQEGYRLSP